MQLEHYKGQFAKAKPKHPVFTVPITNIAELEAMQKRISVVDGVLYSPRREIK